MANPYNKKRGRSRTRNVNKAMESLNQNAKEIFCKIIDAMNGKQNLKLHAKNCFPLIIEQIGYNIDTEFGKGCLYSFCQYFVQNGDLMQDPEMCFLVVDNRTDKSAAIDDVYVFPYMYQLARLCFYECSIDMCDKIVEVKTAMQIKHKLLAQVWLDELKSLGFLKLL
ncbi:MAG: hypothetical protein BGO31_10970 [Bacteroidetes bacterium 43-16]|nr:MAG: hypothetical protein BGO31_10970 [Bacteroidetes bacterium 43-16]